MKIKALIMSISFLICFPILGFAETELVMQKEVLNYSAIGIGDQACMELIIIKKGSGGCIIYCVYYSML